MIPDVPIVGETKVEAPVWVPVDEQGRKLRNGELRRTVQQVSPAEAPALFEADRIMLRKAHKQHVRALRPRMRGGRAAFVALRSYAANGHPCMYPLRGPA